MAATVIQLTDMHLFADLAAVNKGIKPYKSFRAVLEHSRAHYPEADVLLLTGDFSQDNSKESYRHIHKAITSVWQPSADDKMQQVLFVPGNHEDLGVLQEVFQEDPAFVGPGCDLLPVTATVGAWRVLLLASHVPPGHAVHGELQIAALEAAAAELRSLPVGEPLLVAVHHPPVPPAGAPSWERNCLREPEGLLGLLAKQQARLLVHGHLHAEHCVEREGLTMLGAPSTCHQYRIDTEDFCVDMAASPGYRVLHLDPDGTYRTESCPFWHPELEHRRNPPAPSNDDLQHCDAARAAAAREGRNGESPAAPGAPVGFVQGGRCSQGNGEQAAGPLRVAGLCHGS